MITRDNYETFFLLYTDNELSVAEKKAVDEFVLANPDLEEELVVLQQSVLKPDHIVFGDIKTLLKNETVSEDIREKLLLKLDNELSATEVNNIDELIVADTAIEKEWETLGKTKLQHDNTIVFADKQSLYRKEGGSVVVFPWRKLAVAALLVGLGVWGAMQYFNTRNTVGDNVIANTGETKQPVETLRPSVKESQVAVPVDSGNGKESVDNQIASTEKKSKRSSVETEKNQPGKAVKENVARPDNQVAVSQPKDNNLPKSYLEKINNNGSNKIVTASVTPSKQADNIVNALIKKSTDEQDAANIARTAAFTETSEENNDHVLYMDEDKVKKTKLGGFFRKVKRVVERSTSIKTGGNNFKVANLEFAIQ